MNMRSPLWFVVAAVIGIAGIAGAWFYAAPRLGAFADGLQQVVMPGPATVTLDRAGAYTIFAERHSVVDGRLYDSPPPQGARITLTSEQTGKIVAMAAPHASVEYSIQGRQGHAVLGFTVDQPGRYRLAATGPADGGYVLAIGQGSAMGRVGSLFRTILVTVALALGGLGIAGIIAIVTVLQRDKAKKAAVR